MTSMEIPEFPNFRSITADDCNLLQSLVADYPPYSDFNFTSLYTWDTQGEHQIATMHSNLVLRLSDYVTGQPVFSVLGTTSVDTTITELNDYICTIPNASIKLIPEITKTAITNTDHFNLQLDPDNFDYIFSIQELSELAGGALKSKRHAAAKCQRDYPQLTIQQANLDSSTIKEELLAMTLAWQEAKQLPIEETKQEQLAIKRLLDTTVLHSRLRLTCASYKENVVGFSIDELLPKGYVLSHYFKTLPEYVGLGEVLNQTIAKQLDTTGYTFWNWEQDLGIPGLRKMKRSYRPVAQLKKYKITNEK